MEMTKIESHVDCMESVFPLDGSDRGEGGWLNPSEFKLRLEF